MAADQRMIDTNVLIYSTVSGNPWHANARQWLAGLQGIAAVYHHYRNAGDNPEDVPGFSKVASVDEVKRHGYRPSKQNWTQRIACY